MLYVAFWNDIVALSFYACFQRIEKKKCFFYIIMFLKYFL